MTSRASLTSLPQNLKLNMNIEKFTPKRPLNVPPFLLFLCVSFYPQTQNKNGILEVSRFELQIYEC